MTEEAKDEKEEQVIVSSLAIKKLVTVAFMAGNVDGLQPNPRRGAALVDFLKSIDLAEAITNPSYFDGKPLYH